MGNTQPINRDGHSPDTKAKGRVSTIAAPVRLQPRNQADVRASHTAAREPYATASLVKPAACRFLPGTRPFGSGIPESRR
jgi:hypothetical protein